MPMSTTLVMSGPGVPGIREDAARGPELPDDLRRPQVPVEALLRGSRRRCSSARSRPARRRTGCRGRRPGCRPSPRSCRRPTSKSHLRGPVRGDPVRHRLGGADLRDRLEAVSATPCRDRSSHRSSPCAGGGSTSAPGRRETASRPATRRTPASLRAAIPGGWCAPGAARSSIPMAAPAVSGFAGRCRPGRRRTRSRSSRYRGPSEPCTAFSVTSTREVRADGARAPPRPGSSLPSPRGSSRSRALALREPAPGTVRRS